jgi:hypothetical protein
MLDTFDRLLLLQAGNVVFYGSVPDADRYFALLGLPVPAGENP